MEQKINYRLIGKSQSQIYSVTEEISDGLVSQYVYKFSELTDQDMDQEDFEFVIGKSACEQLENEWEVLKSISHPNIVSVYNFYKNVQNNQNGKYGHTIQMEQGECDYLVHLRDENPSLDQRINMIYQIGTALSYLHGEMMVAHNDVKIENVLCFQNRQLFKLSDFGYSNKQQQQCVLNSALSDHSDQVKQHSFAESSQNEDTSSSSFVTVSQFEEQNFYDRWYDRATTNLPPEILEFQQSGGIEKPIDEIQSDIFQFGVLIFFTILRGIYPYHVSSLRTQDSLYKYICQKDFDSFWNDPVILQRIQSNFPGNSAQQIHNFKQIIQQTIAYNPQERVSIQNLLQHPFFLPLQQ